MKIKTKSGFACNINERKCKDWRFIKLLAKCDSPDESSQLEGTTKAVNFLFGDEGEEALMNHVTDEEGLVDSAKLIAEFKEVLQLAGAELKKSQSSQE